MTMTRDDAMGRVSVLVGGRPVRWAEPVGDYEGRERTLEVFDADAIEQRGMLRRIRTERTEIEASLGGPLIVVFHTRAESERLHADFLRTHDRAAQGPARRYVA